MFRSFDLRARFDELMLAAGPRHSTARLDLDQRFPKLLGLRTPAGTLFSRQKVVVVGVGSVGRFIAFHLARLGIAVLWLIDPGRYDDPANLLTQQILAADLGHSKAGSTGQACKQISPATRIFAYEGKLQDLDPVLMAEADVVFLATDNLAVEVDASHLFRLLGIPLVQASVHGETLVAQVRFIENRRADGCCLICPFGPEEYRYLNQSSIFRCTGQAASTGSGEQINIMPTMSTSFLCSQAADFALTQWARQVLGLGQPVTDTLLHYCGYTHHLSQSKLGRNKSCRCGHLVLDRRVLPKPIGECTLRELAVIAGLEGFMQDSGSLTLGGLSHVESAVCRCGEHRVASFLPPGETLGTCAACQHPITPQPFYTSRPTPAGDLYLQQDRPLRELGAEKVPWAVVLSNERGVLLRTEDHTLALGDSL